MGDAPPALAVLLLGMADDELVLGHRDSEWTGHAPILPLCPQVPDRAGSAEGRYCTGER